MKKENSYCYIFSGKYTNWSVICGADCQCWYSPRHLCGLGSTLSKEVSRKQSFHAIQSISGRQRGKAMTCVCSFVSLCKMFYRLLQGNQRRKSAGEFSHLYFSRIGSPISMVEQFALSLGPVVLSSLECSVVGQCQRFPQMIHCFDVTSCFVYKSQPHLYFVDCVRGDLPSLFRTRQNYSNKGTLARTAFSCSMSP